MKKLVPLLLALAACKHAPAAARNSAQGGAGAGLSAVDPLKAAAALSDETRALLRKEAELLFRRIGIKYVQLIALTRCIVTWAYAWRRWIGRSAGRRSSGNGT